MQFRRIGYFQGMVLEHALLQVSPDATHQFEKDFAEAGRYIRSIDGYMGHTLHRDADQPGHYLLLVNWRSRSDHETGFRQSTAYQDWKKLLHHYYSPMPKVSYFDQII
ncbi:MAG: antibiotic biosynthesis monooxygenase family protein [Bacteroidota bacterium]